MTGDEERDEEENGHWDENDEYQSLDQDNEVQQQQHQDLRMQVILQKSARNEEEKKNETNGKVSSFNSLFGKM